MNLAEKLKDVLRADLCTKYGLDKASPKQVSKALAVLLDALPTDKIKRHADELLLTGKLIDKIAARQIGILLFAQQELGAIHDSLTPEEARQACREIMESLKGEMPGGKS